ncbi:beta/gamma crystallin-related protein [Ramlibacter sp. PS4R-6]|uniref:beta/gamma crystallin-related protein n=1 Tax=Ramlibacter sp. PS4R-6 TaxID=3133438 RepID=UPI0030AF6F8B
MKRTLHAIMAAAALVAAGQAAAQITLYEGEGFRGRAITTNEKLWNLQRTGMNDRVSSIIVDRGRWEVCEHARFEGRCVVLRRGSYPSLREAGLNNSISSVRPFEGRSRAEPVAAVPMPAPEPRWRVRGGEETYEVPVAQVRGISGPPSQRCWVERQQVAEAAPARSNEPNIGGAVIGGIVGGILGHQVGGGTGKDLATAGGAVAGAVVGSNIANNNAGGSRVVNRDVQRCENVANAQPEYYDVVYFHNNTEHHVQMKYPPGPTIRVNARGEPRQ